MIPACFVPIETRHSTRNKECEQKQKILFNCQRNSLPLWSGDQEKPAEDVGGLFKSVSGCIFLDTHPDDGEQHADAIVALAMPLPSIRVFSSHRHGNSLYLLNTASGSRFCQLNKHLF